MRFRLTHVLILMALMLAAGVVGVQQYEARRGPTAVPGLIVIDAPWLDAGGGGSLLRTWPDARLGWVAADASPLSPFGADYAQRRLAHGAHTVLVRPPASFPALQRGPWETVIDAGDDGPDAARTLANDLVDDVGSLPFLAVLPLAEVSCTVLDSILRTLHLAVVQLPSFRSTSLVVLGERDPGAARRLALRVDRGRSPHQPRAGLADLLEDDW